MPQVPAKHWRRLHKLYPQISQSASCMPVSCHCVPHTVAEFSSYGKMTEYDLRSKMNCELAGADLNDSRSGMLLPFKYAMMRETPAPLATGAQYCTCRHHDKPFRTSQASGYSSTLQRGASIHCWRKMSEQVVKNVVSRPESGCKL